MKYRNCDLQLKMFGMDNFLGMMGARNFSVQLRCYSMIFFPKADADKIDAMNYGGNILLPNSALDTLTRLNVQYPLLFKISGLSPEHQKVTHAGVLEFNAEEGKCYLPSWMMKQLLFIEGEMAAIEYRSLPMAQYAKFKPMSSDFLNISNPRAILEVELRKFRCLTKNDVITIAYNDQILEFKVMDLKPQNAVSITECDVNLEFDAPEGYVEPKVAPKSTEMPEAPAAATKPTGWAAFCGEGMRLDGKRHKAKNSSDSSLQSSFKSENESDIGDIIVDEAYKPGALTFIRFNYKNRTALLRDQKEKASGSGGGSVFSGSGFTIRSK